MMWKFKKWLSKVLGLPILTVKYDTKEINLPLLFWNKDIVDEMVSVIHNWVVMEINKMKYEDAAAIERFLWRFVLMHDTYIQDKEEWAKKEEEEKIVPPEGVHVHEV